MRALRIGLLSSVGPTLDAFFPEIINRWRSLGHQVYPASGAPTSRVTGSELLRGMTRLPSLHSWQAARAIQRWVQNTEIDVLVTNTATASFVARSVKLAAPTVYFCHGLHWSDKRTGTDAIWKGLELMALRRTAGVIVLNGHDHQWFERQAPTLPLLRLVAGVGVDLRKYPRSTVPSTGQRRLVWAGELTARKRPLDVIATASYLRNAGADFHIDLLGEGPLRHEVRVAIAASGLEKQVTMHGHVPVHDYMMRAHLVMHTAAWEGLPRVLLEAVATGRTPVGYDVKGVRDIPGVVTAPFGDAKALALTILNVDPHTGANSAIAPSALAVETAADRILEFIGDGVLSGSAR